MNNNEILSKLTIGTEETETVTVYNNDEKIEVDIRPLTTGELTNLQSLEKKSFRMKMKMNRNGELENVERQMSDNTMDISMSDFTEFQAKAMYTAIAWSMGISVKEVQSFKPGVPEQIFEAIIDLNSLSENDLICIKQFRNDK